ncbi:unnamed protein product [Closterium sp. Naga37s-1]|nr:unnamed protein product [Closterium sp. Naga37s-1]
MDFSSDPRCAPCSAGCSADLACSRQFGSRFKQTTCTVDELRVPFSQVSSSTCTVDELRVPFSQVSSSTCTASTHTAEISISLDYAAQLSLTPDPLFPLLSSFLPLITTPLITTPLITTPLITTPLIATPLASLPVLLRPPLYPALYPSTPLTLRPIRPVALTHRAPHLYTPPFANQRGAMNAVRERLSRKPSSKGGRYVAYFLSAPPRLAGCQNTVTLSPPEQVAYLRSKNAQSKIWFRTQKQLFGRRNSRVRLLDITHPSLARADAMIGSQGKASMDCLHPCLPGLPDNWVDLFYAAWMADKGF